MQGGAHTYPEEPDCIRREPEHIARARRTKAAPSQTRPIAPCELPSTVSLLRCPQSPHGGAQIIAFNPFAIPSSAPTLDGGFGPADLTLRHEVHSDDLAHLDIPKFLRRGTSLHQPPPHRGHS